MRKLYAALGLVVTTAVLAMPSGLSAGLDTTFCAGWTLAGNAQCIQGRIGQAGNMAGNTCIGFEPFGDVGSLTSGPVTAGSIVFGWSVITSDGLPYDYIFVDTIGPLGTIRVAQLGFPSYLGAGVCLGFGGVANINLGANCASSCQVRIGVHEDGFGDTLQGNIAGVAFI